MGKASDRLKINRFTGINSYVCSVSCFDRVWMSIGMILIPYTGRIENLSNQASKHLLYLAPPYLL